MSHTKIFRAQHKRLLEGIREIEVYLDAARIVSHADDLHRQLVALVEKLSTHLMMEDKNLYPMLLQSGDTQARKTAARFMNEMGSLSSVVKKQMIHWSNGDAIKADPEEFFRQTCEMLHALVCRIEREEQTLYPLADAL